MASTENNSNPKRTDMPFVIKMNKYNTFNTSGIYPLVTSNQ